MDRLNGIYHLFYGHPTSAENTYHKITFQNYGGNKTNFMVDMY